jgi:hypothetical protein
MSKNKPTSTKGTKISETDQFAGINSTAKWEIDGEAILTNLICSWVGKLDIQKKLRAEVVRELRDYIPLFLIGILRRMGRLWKLGDCSGPIGMENFCGV